MLQCPRRCQAGSFLILTAACRGLTFLGVLVLVLVDRCGWRSASVLPPGVLQVVFGDMHPNSAADTGYHHGTRGRGACSVFLF